MDIRIRELIAEVLDESAMFANVAAWQQVKGLDNARLWLERQALKDAPLDLIRRRALKQQERYG
ncbi:MAG: hypothetical protein R2865_03730 [Deinococcales bacterium]